eukprot:11227465-Lingulodinium_polyedra.AAC.1
MHHPVAPTGAPTTGPAPPSAALLRSRLPPFHGLPPLRRLFWQWCALRAGRVMFQTVDPRSLRAQG